MKSVLDKLIQKPKIENADYMCSKTSLLLTLNQSKSCFPQKCAHNRCADM